MAIPFTKSGFRSLVYTLKYIHGVKNNYLMLLKLPHKWFSTLNWLYAVGYMILSL